MGAPVALASDPLKRSSFFQIAYLCIKHLLRYDSVRFVNTAIRHFSHTQNSPCTQFPTIIGKSNKSLSNNQEKGGNLSTSTLLYYKRQSSISALTQPIGNSVFYRLTLICNYLSSSENS